MPTATPDTTRNDTGPRNMPLQQRGAELVPSTYNEADNTIDVVWTTGARVRRYDWWNDTPYEEELAVEPDAVNMSRFEAGAVQVLDNHSAYGSVSSILGVATSARIENGQGTATLRLSNRPELAGIVADIRSGIIRTISVGYSVERYEITRAQDRTDGVNLPLYRAAAWTPKEISFVTVPADADAGTRSQPSNGSPCEFIRAPAHNHQETTMPTAAETQPGAATNSAPDNQARAAAAGADNDAAEAARAAQAAADAATRAADITDLCTRHGVPQLAAGLIRGGNSVDQARGAVLDELARQDAASGGHRNARIETVRDEVETRQRGMEEALLHRVAPRTELTDNGRQFRGLTLLELGREFLQARGIDSRGWDRMRLAGEMTTFRSGMHSTSDFAALLGNVASARLRAAYEENPGTYAQWARRAPNAPDFKNLTVVQLSGAPELLRVNEAGEFSYGTLQDGAESYKVLTHGRIVSLTRQAIVNDDLRGFDRLVGSFGASSRRLENRMVYSQLTSNVALSDGKALFHAAHGNIGTGAESALQLPALGAARAAMRLQKGLQKEELNLTPAYLIVPTGLEQTAYQLTSANYVPAKQSDINEFRAGGRTALTPIVEPILDAVSATAWYLASENSLIDTVEYCYLDGAEGPVIESQAGFEVDGISYKCRLDFAAKAIDYRGLYKGVGA